MRIVIIGGAGTVGKAVVSALSDRHEVVVAGRNSGAVRVDIGATESVRSMYEHLGTVDAVICTAGDCHFGPFQSMAEQDVALGLESKLMGQVRLVLEGRSWISDGGSFTLTSGFLFDDPIPESVGFAVANGGVEGFVRSAALSLPRGVRINAVSPGIAEDSAAVFGPFNPGTRPVPMRDIAAGFQRSVEGARTGEIIHAW